MKSDDPVARLFALERFGIKLGLENIRTLTAALGHPQHGFATVHIAGTNGKGSVTAMVERALRDAGHRTGRYTSPHLSRIEERIAIDGVPVTEAMFCQVAGDVLDLADGLRARGTLETTPTFFEATTAMAFEIFRRSGVQAAVIEVGLGGRFDATNVMAPLATAITSIALDHERHLGYSLADIAREKAGIIRPGVPIVVGDMAPEPRAVIEDIAARQGAPMLPAGLDFTRDIDLTHGRATVSIVTPTRSYDAVRLGLSGAHQIGNAVVAARVLEACDGSGLGVAAENIRCGLTDVSWPARLEWIDVPGAGELLLDAAHNPAGAEALAGYLRDRGVAPVPIALALMKDKDARGIVRALATVASRFVATTVPGERARHADALAADIRRSAEAATVVVVTDPDAAVAAALSDGRRAVATGSFFFVGPLRARLLAAGAVSFQSR